MSTELPIDNAPEEITPPAPDYQTGKNEKEKGSEAYATADQQPGYEEESETLKGQDHHAGTHYDRAAGIANLQQSHIIPLSGDRKPTKKSEIISYCLMYIAITGLGPFNFQPAQQQNLYVQQFPSGFVNWGGSSKPIASFILDLNGIQFAIQLVLLIIIGPYADYGTWRPYILIFFTVISWGISFGWVGLTQPSQWQAVSALYVLSTVCFNLVNTYYFSAFPGLVRDLPIMIESEQEVVAGTKSPEEHAELDMRERSKLSNYSLATSAGGSCLILCLGLVVPYTVGDVTTAQNTRGFAILCGYFAAIWVIFAIPWFVTEQYRPGQQFPAGVKTWMVGPRQTWEAVRSIWRLKYTFLYLISFFMLNDVYNTSSTIIQLLQARVLSFSTRALIEVFILAFGCQAIGAFGVQQLQRWLKFSAKTGCLIGAISLTLTVLWGFIGIWTNAIGYHHAWEFYLFQAFTGIFVAAWNTYSNTMISEVVPAPKMYLFFSLFFIVGKTSAFVGPFITSAIISDSGGNTSTAFWFLLFSGLVGIALLALVNVDKAKQDCARFLEMEAAALYSPEQLREMEKAGPAITHVPHMAMGG